MNIKNSFQAIALWSSLLLSPAVANKIDNTKWEVYQLVWNKLIPTTMDIMLNLWIKTKNCLKFTWDDNKTSIIYISDETDIIPTWEFSTLTKEELELVNKISEPCN